MKRIYTLLVLVFFAWSANAQNTITWTDNFTSGVSTTPAQLTTWNNFKSQLLPSYNYTKMTIKGSADPVGQVCTDPIIVAAFANAIYTNANYISPLTNGNTWSYCTWMNGEVWLNPPSNCSGANCPNPGYIVRPGIGNSNFGGINTATCGGPTQSMILEFEYAGVTLNCPSNIVVDNDPGVCGAVVSYTAPVGTGTNPPVTTVLLSGLGSGSTFPIGTSTEVYQAYNTNGDTATCSFTVTVNDTTTPTITCPTNITVSNDSGVCGAVVNYTVVGNHPCAITLDSATFNHTGSVQTWTVPAGVTSINFEAAGAAGGNGGTNSYGGLGGLVTGDIPVTPGQTLSIYVGELGQNTSGNNPGVPGSYNGGGAGGSSIGGTSQPGGAAGGGASDIRIGGITLNDRVVVAGGGGGAGGGTSGNPTNGGAGGGLTAGDGTSYASGLGHEATGGTQTAGGNAGTYSYGPMTGGQNGSLGLGGDGWSGGYSGGGGGGAGYYGGGGGSTHFESGGGGGSSYTDPSATNVIHTQGVQTGNGYVKIKWGSTTAPTLVSGLASGSTFPIGVTTNTFDFIVNGDTATCSFTVTVADTTKPTVTCPGNVATCDSIVNNIAPSTTDNCTGETVAYTITGATTGNGTNDASGTSFNEGLSTVKYIVTDASGNQDSCSFTVEVQTSSSTISPVSCGSYTAPSGAVYTMSNTYMDTIPNSNMCDSVITINLTVVNVDTSTSLNGLVISSNATGVTYQWLNCDSGYAVIAGATSQNYTATANGNYAVEVTDTNGCVDTSACVAITGVGINEFMNYGINIYPNPTNDVINIDMGSYQGLINYELVSVEGKVIQSVKGVSNKKIQIDLRKESKGIYLLKLYNAEGVGVHRIIKE